MLDINSSALKELIEKTISKGDSYAEKNILAYEAQLGVHIYGDKPTEILDQYRPGETAEIKKYRLAAYKPKTKAEFDKALNVLYSIFNPKLFHISYPEAPKFLGEEDTLKNYINEDFPCGFGSLLQYVKTVLLKKMLASPNGCVVILPVKNDIAPNEFVSPFPYFYETKEILAYVPDNYILVTKTKDTYWLVDDTNIIEIAKQTQDFFTKDKYTIQIVYTHNLGYLPAFQIGGLQDMKGNSKIFRSYIDGAIPHWDDAVRLESDLQACYVQHMYPERVEVEMPCNDCGSTGVRYTELDEKIPCHSCDGRGSLNHRSPYGVRKYKLSETFGGGDNSLYPGVTYIQKDVEIVKMLQIKVDSELEKGLEAISMDIIRKVGENQSGIAKMYDRKQLNDYIQQISDRVWTIYEDILFYVNAYRYKTLLGEKTDLYLPSINKPTKFDVLVGENLATKISLAIQTGQDKSFMTHLEIMYARLEFGEDSLEYKTIETVKLLNPFGDKTIDELMTANAMLPYDATKLFISLNITSLVNQCYMKDNTFFEKTLKKRNEIISKLAETEKAKAPKPPTIPVAPLI